MFYFSPTKIDRVVTFIMVFSRYIRIYMDVGILVYGCISDDAGSHRATSAVGCGHAAAALTGPTTAPARNTSKLN